MYTRLDFAKLDLMDALDMAVLIEFEAYQRYKAFATQLGHRYEGDATSVFETMAENEAKHGQVLDARRKEKFGDVPRRVSLADLYDVEAPDVGAIRSNMSTLAAFELALTSEQKAHDFYDDALPHITDPEIRELFTELRDEETEHVQLVKDIIAKLPASAAEKVEEDEDEIGAY